MNTLAGRAGIFAAALFIITFFPGCGLKDRDNPNDPKSADYAVTVSITPGGGSVITGNEPLTVTFSDPMVKSSLVLGGELGAAAKAPAEGDWISNRVVTVSPATVWGEGSGTFTVRCLQETGAEYAEESAAYIVEYAVYVRNTDAADSDTNPGTKASPKKTIQAAVDYAAATYAGGAVRVAAGTFQSNFKIDGVPVISMKNDVSVYGGYAVDFSARGASGDVTVVEDTSSTGGSTSAPNRAVYCPTTVTSTATELDSFTIKLADGEYTSGIFCQGNMTISNNVIQGKTAKADGVSEAYGVLILSTSTMMASPIISYNTIDPGYGKGSTDKTYGIYSSGYSLSYPTNVQIEHNTIHGGHGSRSFGIHNINRSNAIILNNLKIDCGSGSVIAYCINIDSNCNPDIEGNTLTNDSNLSTMYGLYEQTTSADPLKVRNNYFNYSSSASKAYYFDEGISSITDLTTSITTCEGNDTLANWGNY